MIRLCFALSLLTLALAPAACGGRPQPAAQPGAQPATDRETLTAQELGQRPFYSVLDAIEALRPMWLNKRGPDGAIQVYVDDNHLGGVEVLRTIRLPSVSIIRHLDGIQATARYGRNHFQGAILVTTRAAGR